MNESETGTENLAFQEAMAILERLAQPGPAWPADTPPRTDELAAGPDSVAQLAAPAAELTNWSEQSLRQVVEFLPDGVVVINASGVIVLVNRQTEQMFGYPRQELLGRLIELLVPLSVRQEHVGYRQRYFNEPHSRPMGIGLELRGRRKDGSEFPVEISLSPLHTGQETLVTAVIRDISARKKEEAKLRSLVENIPAVTFIAPLDQSASQLYVSPQIEQLLGFTQKEWLEDPILWFRQLHPDDQERWNAHFAPTCATGVPFRAVYRFISKDGRVVWVQGSANVVRDTQGRPLLLQGIAFDITAMKEAEEERERFFSLGIDLFCVAGLDGYYKRVNPAFTRTLGYTEEELLSRPLIDFVHPDDREATQAELRKLAEGALTIDFENRYHCKDGSYRWLQWSATPYLPRQVVFAAARDVTQQKQDEESLRRLNAELEKRVEERTEALARSMAELQEKSEELEQFAYVASHDLREPLRSLVNWPQRLAQVYAGQFDAQADDWINRIIRGAERMRRLIDDLSQYSRVLRRDRPFAQVDCGMVAREAQANLQAAIEESGASLDIAELPIVRGNAQQLMLLFQNLIGNAVKFRDPDRPVIVEVRADRQDNGWLFQVKDNGIGMEGKYLQRIFGLGERLHSASKYPGTGFGLAICEKIVTGHGGRIWATSELGQGSTFWFTLPAAPSE